MANILTTERPPHPVERLAEWRYRYTFADAFPDVTDDREPELPSESPEPEPNWWLKFPI